jgi:hypothetical protein
MQTVARVVSFTQRRVSANAWSRYGDYCEAIKSDPRTFFGYVDLKKKHVGYPSVMHFEGRLASGPDDICNFFADFLQRTYADDARAHLLVLFSSL